MQHFYFISIRKCLLVKELFLPRLNVVKPIIIYHYNHKIASFHFIEFLPTFKFSNE